MEKKAILLVEDDSRLREALALYLIDLGFHVDAAEDGIEALSIIKQRRHKRWHAIITDYNMPQLNGAELIKGLLTEQCHYGRCILMSANSRSHPEISEVLAQGTAEYLAKPFAPEVLQQALFSSHSCFSTLTSQSA